MRMKIWALLALLFALAMPAMAQNARPLDPNTATQAQLAAVPELKTVAAEIVAKRPYAGPAAFDAALAAAKLTPEQRAALYTRVWVPMNMNTATRADFALVPGMTPRMVREFEEYQPYKSIEHFRAEIGKYVSKEEVARFEQYLFVPAK